MRTQTIAFITSDPLLLPCVLHQFRDVLPFVAAPDAAAVDRLLDKVAREGLHRLTPAEREQLEKASRR